MEWILWCKSRYLHYLKIGVSTSSYTQKYVEFKETRIQKSVSSHSENGSTRFCAFCVLLCALKIPFHVFTKYLVVSILHTTSSNFTAEIYFFFTRIFSTKKKKYKWKPIFSFVIFQILFRRCTVFMIAFYFYSVKYWPHRNKFEMYYVDLNTIYVLPCKNYLHNITVTYKATWENEKDKKIKEVEIRRKEAHKKRRAR